MYGTTPLCAVYRYRWQTAVLCTRERDEIERKNERERDGHKYIHTYIYAGRQTGREGFPLKVPADSH